MREQTNNMCDHHLTHFIMDDVAKLALAHHPNIYMNFHSDSNYCLTGVYSIGSDITVPR